MSELKPLPCPICGDKLKIHGPEDWKPTYSDPDSGGNPYSATCDCGFYYSNGSYDYSEFVLCLNRRAQPEITGETSDGYHTFNELYHHRAVLFSVICNDRPTLAWKSKLHHDGTMYDGMFIVGIEAPDGQATHHYDIEPYWEMFNVQELPQALEWDGHTPAQAIERIGKLNPQQENEPLTCKDCIQFMEWNNPTEYDGDCRIRVFYSTMREYQSVKKTDFCSFGERKPERGEE